MMLHNYQLGNTVAKLSEDTKLWQSEKGVVEISENTLAISIKLNDQQKGYVFHGQGKLLIDAIVETEEGAIGKPVEKELNKPFLMLGDTEETQQHFITVNKEDLTKMGYENPQEFLAKAENLLDQFLERRETNNRQRFGDKKAMVFAFSNEVNKLDILVVKGSKLVYKAIDIVFVSKKDKAVLKSPSEVVCASDGKSVIIRKGKSIIIKK